MSPDSNVPCLQCPLPAVSRSHSTPAHPCRHRVRAHTIPIPTHRVHSYTPCPCPHCAHGCCTDRGPQSQGVPRRGSPAPQHTVGAVWVPAPSWGHGEQESRKANWSSKLHISGFWFPFLLPAVSMETGVGPGKIRLGFAAEAHWQPAWLCAPPALPPHRGTCPGTPHACTHRMLSSGD